MNTEQKNTPAAVATEVTSREKGRRPTPHQPEPNNNTNQPPNTTTIARTLALLIGQGQVFEIRGLNSSKGTVSGYFDDPVAAVNAVSAMDRIAAPSGWYVTLNPLNPTLLARANNRILPYARSGALSTDAHILRRFWLFVDVDAGGEVSGISATNDEHDAAIGLARTIVAWLAGHGWPGAVILDSGNGAHLLYRIDLPNDDDTRDLLKGVLAAIADEFGDRVDGKVFNSGRITKLYGTEARKGDSMPDRPHRMSRIIEVPGVLPVVGEDLLGRVAELHQTKPTSAQTRPTSAQRRPTSFQRQPGGFEIELWLGSHGIQYTGPLPYQGGDKFQIDCPFNPEHKSPDAVIYRGVDGVLAFRCSHNSCADHRWSDLRELHEPGYKDRRAAWDRSASGHGHPVPVDTAAGEMDFDTAIAAIAAEPDDIGGAALLEIYVGTVAASNWTLPQREQAIKLLASTAKLGVGVVRREVELATPGREQAESLEQNEAADRIVLELQHKWLWDATAQSWYQKDGDVWSPRDPDIFSRHVKKRLTSLVGGFSASYAAGVDQFVRMELSLSDPWYVGPGKLPFSNGVLCLKTLELMDYTPIERWPWMVPIPYVANAPCPVFDDWVTFLSDGAQSKVKLLHCVLSAILRGMHGLQVFFEAIGQGGTGKGAFQHLACQLVGPDNVVSTDLGILGRDKFETGRLYGKRLAVLADQDAYTGGLGVFRQITGGDPVRLDQKSVRRIPTFVYQGIVMVTGNTPLQGNDLTSGLRRRRVHLAFDKHPPRTDAAFYARLDAELPGIVSTLLSYDEDEIREVIVAARDNDENRQVLSETNPIIEWLKECCDVSEDSSLHGTEVGKIEIDRHSGAVLDANRALYPSYVQHHLDGGGRLGDGKMIGRTTFIRMVIDATKQFFGVSVMKRRARISNNKFIHEITRLKLK